MIKNEAQYREYLEQVDRLLDIDPPPNTEKGEKLNLLALLVDAYEKERISIPLPNPIDAVMFRMEEQGLQQKDLIPYLGSKARVSEVLSGKRNLSLKMVKALSEGLGIPAKVLLAEPDPSPDTEQDWDLSRYPLREMAKKGWLGKLDSTRNDELLEAVREFFLEVGGQGVGPVFLRRTLHMGGEISTDFYRINAWLARVLVRSRGLRENIGEFRKPEHPPEFLRNIAQLSWSERGPLLAAEYLKKSGIVLVIEAHLARTYLDGAAILDSDSVPVIALTLRHDRLDNFWFTLLHELAHVLLHLTDRQVAFVDNTEEDPDGEKIEREANRYAREAFIPRAIWRRCEAYRKPSVASILELARDLRISPAIVAGRIRQDSGNYRRFSDLVGHGEVRRQLSPEEVSK